MTIVEIKALENGSHRNQIGKNLTVPEGWAVVPENIELKNFPFGEMETKEIDGVLTVTKWLPGDAPEPYPETEII